MISANCTTSVEAYLLNTISINISSSLGNEEQEFYLPRKVSINTSNVKRDDKYFKKFI